LLPEGVTIDPLTGAMSAYTDRYTKRLSEFRGVYRDTAVLDQMLKQHGDMAIYTVIEYRKPDGDVFFGTTAIAAGIVGDEYFMTRGHFHARRDRGEIYHTQSGQGTLLLQSRTGEVQTVDMKPGTCAFIPPDWAHRSINTGEMPLVFVWCCSQDAGHDYGTIAKRGMAKLLVRRDGAATLIPNAEFGS
jgi:glucose-6-phosphate isomerase, archaeal